MGRTLPTQIWLLKEAEEEWKSFRRALRKEDQRSFDVMWSHARRQSVPASMAARPLPFEAHCLSMLIGLHREILSLREALYATKQSHQSTFEIATALEDGPRDDGKIRGKQIEANASET